MSGSKRNATDAASNGKRPPKQAARKIVVPDRLIWRVVRHLANSRVPFTNGYVASLTGEDERDVAGVCEEAWLIGWLDHAKGENLAGEGQRPRLREMWVGRL